MKRIVLLGLVCATLLTTGAYAQEFGLGGRLGFTGSTLLVDDEDIQEHITFVGGGFVDVHAYKMFNKFVGIEGGLMFMQTGFGFDGTDDFVLDDPLEYKLSYFSIPLSARFKFGYFTLNPGFRPSFLLKAKQDDNDVSDIISDTDVSFFVSPGVQFPIGITINSTLAVGLKNVLETDLDDNDSRSFVFQLSVGYTFFRKSE